MRLQQTVQQTVPCPIRLSGVYALLHMCLAWCERRRWKTAALVRKRAFEDSWQSSTKPKGFEDPGAHSPEEIDERVNDTPDACVLLPLR